MVDSETKPPKAKGSRLRRFVLFWVWLAFCGFVALVALEVEIRLMASGSEGPLDKYIVASDLPGLGFRLAASYEQGNVRTNELGVRWRDPDPEPLDAKILCIGDSVTFAGGVPYADNFCAILESELNRRLDAAVGVWNAGVPGYNTDQESILLEDLGPKIHLDLVIVQFCMNDYLPPPVFRESNGQLDTPQFSGSASFSLRRLLYRSKAIVFLKETFKDLQKTHPEWFPASLHYVHYVHTGEGWQRAKQALLEIRKTCDRLGAALLLVVFPVEQQLRIPDREPQDDLVRFARTHGIPVLDLFELFQSRWREGLFFDRSVRLGTVDKMHLSPKGHEIAGRAIAEAILDDATNLLGRR